MVEVEVVVGDQIPLTWKAGDGRTDLFVRVCVFDEAGVDLPASPITLTHVKKGNYRDLSITMTDTVHIVGDYKAFEDAGFTKPARYFEDSDLFRPKIEVETVVIPGQGTRIEAIVVQDAITAVVKDDAIDAATGEDKIKAKTSEDGISATVAEDKIKAETEC